MTKMMMWRYIANDLREPLRLLLWAGLAGLLLLLALGVLGAARSGKSIGKSIRRALPGVLFLVYLAVAVQVGFFSREPGSRRDINLVLLGTWGHGAQGNAYVVENVIMFLPWGVLLPMVARPLRGRGWLCVPLAAAASSSLEILQYITARGYSQLDDVVMNTAGAALGWLLWEAFLLLLRYAKTKPDM